MESEWHDKTPCSEIEQLIEKALGWNEMYEHFNGTLTQLTNSFDLNLVNNLMRSSFDVVSPFKVQIDLDIPNLEGNIDV